MGLNRPTASGETQVAGTFAHGLRFVYALAGNRGSMSKPNAHPLHVLVVSDSAPVRCCNSSTPPSQWAAETLVRGPRGGCGRAAVANLVWADGMDGAAYTVELSVVGLMAAAFLR